MISFDGLQTGSERAFSAEVADGTSCRIISSSVHQRNLLLGTLVGLRKPEGGYYYLYNRNVFKLDDKEHSELFTHVGLVWRQGGLLSNLRVWENILLPLEYHMKAEISDAEVRTLEILAKLGLEGAEAEQLLQAPSYTVPVYRKMFVGLIRAMLMEPDIMIYDSIFEGLDRRTTGNLKNLVKDFNRATEKRSSIFLCVDDRSLEGIESDIVIDLRSGHGDN